MIEKRSTLLRNAMLFSGMIGMISKIYQKHKQTNIRLKVISDSIYVFHHNVTWKVKQRMRWIDLIGRYFRGISPRVTALPKFYTAGQNIGNTYNPYYIFAVGCLSCCGHAPSQRLFMLRIS